jgi:CYTH domain-containing protein
MPTELERKFLIAYDTWRDSTQGQILRQGYLSRDPNRIVRVRQVDAQGFLTIKGATEGISRTEFEYAIPAADAQALLQLCLPPLIEKTRHHRQIDGHLWEIDEFHGENAGLVVAEIELESADTPFSKPAWLGEEVSHLPRYFNSQLAEFPYSKWPADWK